MTLCGWKIFSKGKQKTKRTKTDATCSSTLNAVECKTLKVTSKNDFQSKTTKGESPARDSISWDIHESAADNGDYEEGNPRNKCALKPGHSLMDWIRLGSSGCDLSGTKGVLTPVSYAELAKHCKQDDAWLAIRGKVYNVTHYMEFHPGGPDELLKGVGKDATKLFDDVHAWVNYEQLLAKCYIGPLRNSAIIDLEPSKPLHKTSSDNSGSFRMPLLPFLQTTSAKTSPIKSATNASSDYGLGTDQQLDIIPRFDWIQKTSDLTFIFYTKSLCNPGLVISYTSDIELVIRIQIDRTTHVCSVKLTHEVNFPCVIKISNETGKIELRFPKTKPQLWTNYGTMERQKLIETENLQFDFKIAERQAITHDSYALVLQSLQKVLLCSPIGYHISITATIEGADITRSYTPVPAQYVSMDVLNSNVALLVKSYEMGTMSKYMTSTTCDTLSVSQPRGNFFLTKLKEHLHIGLMAAGSGVTPILSVLEHLLDRVSNRVENIQLMLFNKTEQDIWCRQKLETMTKKDNRLIVRHVLSEPLDGWLGEIGRVSDELIVPFVDPKSQLHVTFCCVCGPTPFNTLSQKLLVEAGFPSSQLHFFQG